MSNTKQIFVVGSSGSGTTIPVKLGLAFLLNIKRIGNMAEVINKRFF